MSLIYTGPRTLSNTLAASIMKSPYLLVEPFFFATYGSPFSGMLLFLKSTLETTAV